jgi:hypothetical protein
MFDPNAEASREGPDLAELAAGLGASENQVRRNGGAAVAQPIGETDAAAARGAIAYLGEVTAPIIYDSDGIVSRRFSSGRTAECERNVGFQNILAIGCSPKGQRGGRKQEKTIGYALHFWPPPRGSVFRLAFLAFRITRDKNACAPPRRPSRQLIEKKKTLRRSLTETELSGSFW